MAFVVEEMRPSDWPQVLAIYMAGIATGHATFETEGPTWERWDSAHLKFARLVARSSAPSDGIKGWGALSPVSSRHAYRGVAEVSVYVEEHERGAGVGRALLASLIAAAERGGIWTLQASIFPENEASRRLHLSCGFREVGRRERLGKMKGRWRDVVLLERRSGRVGTE